MLPRRFCRGLLIISGLRAASRIPLAWEAGPMTAHQPLGCLMIGNARKIFSGGWPTLKRLFQRNLVDECVIARLDRGRRQHQGLFSELPVDGLVAAQHLDGSDL